MDLHSHGVVEHSHGVVEHSHGVVEVLQLGSVDCPHGDLGQFRPAIMKEPTFSNIFGTMHDM